MLALAAKRLGPLKDEVVFVGGATIELYISDCPVDAVRPTDDVDCVANVVSRMDYYKLEERLRALGFRHPLGERAPICRWEYRGLLIDVMPIEGTVLGFSNQWYREGFDRAIPARIPGGPEIRIFPLPYLIASKIEAFMGRGKEDFIASSDMEDIVTLVDGAADFKAEVARAPENVRKHLKEQFQRFLRDIRFLDALQGHLPPPATPVAGPDRAERARAILEDLCGKAA